jgi:hypothetical protein
MSSRSPLARLARLLLASLVIAVVVAPSGRAVAQAPAQASRVVGQLGGQVRGAIPDGEVLWVGMGPRLVAVDWSVDASPRIVGASPALTGLVSDMARLRDHFVVAAGNELVVLDARDRARITVRAAIELPGPISLVRAWGDSVYVTAELGGDPPRAELRIYDLADPAAPRLLGSGSVNGSVEDAELYQDALYLAADSYLYVIDISDPAAVHMVTIVGICCIRQVERSGSWLAIVRHDYRRGVEMTERIDISRPFQPSDPEGYGTDKTALQLLTSGGRIYEAGTQRYGEDSYLWVNSDPSGPMAWLAQAVLPAPPSALAATERRAWVPTGDCGWHSLAHDPPALSPSNSHVDLPFAGSSWAWPADVAGLAVAGSIAYLTSGQTARCARLDVVDLEHPETPVLAATLPLGQSMNRAAAGPGHTIFLAGGDYYKTGGLLRALDVTKPTAPRLGDLAHFDDEILGFGYDSGTGRVYVSVPVNRPMFAAGAADADESEDTGRLLAFDVPGPGRLVEAGRLALGAEPGGLAARDGLVFVTERRRRPGDMPDDVVLQVVDFRAPSSPRILATLALDLPEGHRPALALAGSQLFVAGSARLWVDVADPSRPRVIARAEAPPGAVDWDQPPAAVASGGVVAVAEGDLALYAGGSAASMTPFQRFSAPGTAMAVALDGRRAMLAQRAGGLAVVDVLPAGWRPASALYLPSLVAPPQVQERGVRRQVVTDGMGHGAR